MIEPRLERLLGWARNQPQPPTKIEFFPTYECQSRCIFCHRRGLPEAAPLPELSRQEALRLVAESAALGVLEWHLIGGGEPLAAGAACREIMAAIKRHGMYGYLNTNGQLFTPELVEELVALQWDYIKISLHGHDAQSHDHMTGIPGSFASVIQALDQFRRLKQQYRCPQPRLEIGPVLNRLNYRHLIDLVAIAKEYQVEEFRPQALTVYSDDCRPLRLTDEDQAELDQQVVAVAAFAEQHGIVTNIMDFRKFELLTKSNRMDEVIAAEPAATEEHPFLRAACYEPFYHLTIHSWGNVGICGFTDMDSCLPIGGRSLSDIWYSPAFNRVRQDMRNGQLQQYCSHCVSVLVMQNMRIREALRPHLGNVQSQPALTSERRRVREALRYIKHRLASRHSS